MINSSMLFLLEIVIFNDRSYVVGLYHHYFTVSNMINTASTYFIQIVNPHNWLRIFAINTFNYGTICDDEAENIHSFANMNSTSTKKK